jgi:hypothetical protein
MSCTLEKMCFGTTKMPFRLTEMNCESLVLSLMTTPYVPFCLTEATFVSLRNIPRMSIVGACRPAVRL